MNTEIIEIIGKILAAFFVGICAYLAPKVKNWLESNMDKSTNENIQKLIDTFVKSAEQLFHDNDPTGLRRKEFVIEQLKALNVEITEQIRNMIEGAVWEVNNRNKLASNEIEYVKTDYTACESNNEGNSNGNS